MRSNGAAHIGNDTFLAATRDNAESLFLFTGAFSRAERIDELPLRRRVHVSPCSSLDMTREEREKFETATAVARPSGSSRPPAEAGPGVPSVCEQVRQRRFDLDMTAGLATGTLVRPVSSSAAAGAVPAQDGAGSAAAAEESAVLARHSLHVSCDGHRVAMIASGCGPHYVIDITSAPSEVTEIVTAEVVRSACWHATAPHLLLLLSVSGVLTVYDTTAAHLGVVFVRSQQTNLRPMLDVVLRDKMLMLKLQHEAAQPVHEAAAAPAKGSAVGGLALPKLWGTAGRSGTEPIGSAQRLIATPRVSVGSRASGGGRPSTAAARVASTSPDAASTSSPRGSWQPPRSGRQPGTPRSSRKAGVYTLDDFGLPARLTGPTSPRMSLGSARSSKPRASGAERSASHPVPVEEAPRSRGSPSPAPLTVQQPAATPPLTCSGPSPTVHHSVAGTAEAGAVAAVEEEPRRDTAAPWALYPTKESADADVVHREADAGESTALDLVDMCVVRATASLPNTLLLLSSSGDVFSVKLNAYCLPATGSAVASDGAVPLSTAQAAAAAAANAAQSRLPHFCHVVQGDSHRERSGAAPEPAPGTAGDGAAPESAEALAVRCCLLDEDAGLHVIVVVYASGCVRGALVDEADLIARHRVGSADRSCAMYGASNFTVHLGAAVNARSLLSPVVPSTTHTLQVSAHANVLLLRMGGGGADSEAAYLIALPVLDRQRKGWSYWCPSQHPGAHPVAGSGSAEAQKLQLESLRLPLISTETQVPEPLAVRLPLDVRGASVAIGQSDILVFPELAAGGSCPRTTIVTLKTTTLLRSALYARAAAVQPLGIHRPAGDGVSERERVRGPTRPAITAAPAALFPPTIDAPSQRNSSSGSGRRSGALRELDAAAATVRAEADVAAVEILTREMLACHRKFLCGYPPQEVDEQTASLTAVVEAQLQATRRREQAVQRRHAAVQARVEALGARLQGISSSVDSWTATLLDGIAHRRGPGAIQAANHRLGEVHEMLTERERAVTAAARRAAASAEVERRGGRVTPPTPDVAVPTQKMLDAIL